MRFHVVPSQNDISFHEQTGTAAVLLEFGALKSCTAGFFQCSRAATTAAPTVVHCKLQGAGWIVVLLFPRLVCLANIPYTGLFCNTFWVEMYTDGYVINICASALFPRLVYLTIICTSALIPRLVYLAIICTSALFSRLVYLASICKSTLFPRLVYFVSICTSALFPRLVYLASICTSALFPRLFHFTNICISALFPRLVYLVNICTNALFPRLVYLVNVCSSALFPRLVYLTNICTSALFPQLVYLVNICTSALFPLLVYLANICTSALFPRRSKWQILVRCTSHENDIQDTSICFCSFHIWFVICGLLLPLRGKAWTFRVGPRRQATETKLLTKKKPCKVFYSIKTLRDFGLSSRCSWGLRSSWMLRSVCK